ncbi:hypothetical protein C8F01DRAFT_1091915 [Mycena amicta]|nr:hypothetical protein C8F01DRAFT_1091915 [Mycena amicta]
MRWSQRWSERRERGWRPEQMNHDRRTARRERLPPGLIQAVSPLLSPSLNPLFGSLGSRLAEEASAESRQWLDALRWVEIEDLECGIRAPWWQEEARDIDGVTAMMSFTCPQSDTAQVYDDGKDRRQQETE